MKDTEKYRLQQVAEWNHNYFVTSLVSHLDRLVVGDAISSVSLLKVTGVRMECLSRDYGPIWPVAVGALSHNQIIGANVRVSGVRGRIQLLHLIPTERL